MSGVYNKHMTAKQRPAMSVLPPTDALTQVPGLQAKLDQHKKAKRANSASDNDHNNIRCRVCVL